MIQPIWSILDLTARWEHTGFRAEVSLQRSDRGLHDVHVSGRRLEGAELLGLVLPGAVEQPDRFPQECHARARDLMAQYPESASWPIHVEVVWRVIPPDVSRGILAGVDVIASVRTALLESWPELAVGSLVAAEEVFRLTDAASARFEACAVAGEGRAAESAKGPGLFVARLERTPLSYAEMVHPADGQGSTASRTGEKALLLCTRHRLFAERLEKGVMLRSRVRGVVLDRARDLQVAAGCYAEFAAADPPLGT